MSIFVGFSDQYLLLTQHSVSLGKECCSIFALGLFVDLTNFVLATKLRKLYFTFNWVWLKQELMVFRQKSEMPTIFPETTTNMFKLLFFKACSVIQKINKNHPNSSNWIFVFNNGHKT